MSAMTATREKFAALDLSSPAALRGKTSEELQAAQLSGYEAMRKIRDDAAKFRRDYSNWRKGGASGAAGQGLKGSKVEDRGSGLRLAHNPLTEVGAALSLPLRRAHLDALRKGSKGALTVPASTGRPKCTALIAHIGVGGFHRSHQAYMTDVLLERAATETAPSEYDEFTRRRRSDSVAGQDGGLAAQGEDAWGILGVGLMPWDKRMYETLRSQDYLYTLVTRGNSGSAARVIQAVQDFVFLPENPDAGLKRLCEEKVRILSLTVTEKGYYRDASGHLDAGNALVAEDVAAWATDAAAGAVGLKQPKTAFGLICTVLARRRAADLGPLTVLSCDNLPMNGSVCRGATLEFATLVSPDLKAWIEAKVPFPSSMVDRITPVTKPEHVSLVEDEYGVKDGWPVVAEPFLQWVIEDNFANGRPNWENAASGDNESVLFVDDVEPYELMKLRLLNSSHSAMAYVSLLAEHDFVDEALGDIDVLTFLRAYMSEVVTRAGNG